MDALVPELRRSTTDGKVAGVCVMFADRWRIDPLLVRIAAILLALSSGIGLVLYAAAWLVIPPAGSDRAPIDSVLPGARRLGRTAWVLALVVACITAAALLRHLVPFGIGPAVVMGAVWYFGCYRPRQQRTTAAAPPAPALGSRPFAEATPFTEAAADWQSRVQTHLQTQGRAPAALPAPAAPRADPGYSPDAFLAHPDPVGLYAEPSPAQTVAPAPPAPSRQRRRRTRTLQVIGWALALGALVAVAVVDSAYQLPFVTYPAALLAVVGLTFVIGAWLPRPRGLFVVALLLTLVTGFSAMAPGLPAGEQMTVAYSSSREVPSTPVVHEIGSLDADLSRMVLESDTTYEAGVELGRLTVIVPPEVNVRVEWQVEAGGVDVLGLHRESGMELASTTIRPGADPNGPTLTIRARVSMGTLEVRR